MLKQAILFTTLILTFFGAQGQEFRSGIKGGVNFSNLYIDDVDDRNIRTGYHVGFYGQSKLNSFAALQLELLYTTKGNQSTFNTGLVQGDVEFKLDYIEVPVLINLKAGDILEFHAGPSFGFLINSEIESSSGNISTSSNLNEDRFKTLDVGFALGAGLNFDNLQVGGRFTWGLSEIADNDTDGFEDAKNALGQVYVAIGL